MRAQCLVCSSAPALTRDQLRERASRRLSTVSMRNAARQFRSSQLPGDSARAPWKRRFEKVHSQAGRAFPKRDGVSKELDSSMSSDALLMNIFCYPGLTKRRELSLRLGTEIGDLPQFGFKPRIPLTSGFVERTEIDMKLGPVLFEAKLTESDFQTRRRRSSKDIAT